MYHFRYMKNISILISIVVIFMTLVILSYYKLTYMNDINSLIIPKVNNPETQKSRDREGLWEGIAKDREKNINVLQEELLKVKEELKHYQSIISLKAEHDKEKLKWTKLENYLNLLKNTPGRNGSISKLEIQGGEPKDELNKACRQKVKNMMKIAWDNYVKYAWGENELRPLTKVGHSASIFGQNRMGISIIDSLDTLFIMELNDEFKVAADWIKTKLNFNLKTEVSVFEMTIRFLGGLLTAFIFTKDQVFLDKSIELANNLLNAFDDSGLPYALINFESKFGHNYQWAEGGCAILSEVGTLHMEFAFLSEITGNVTYLNKVNRIREILHKATKPQGIYMNYIQPKSHNWCGYHSSLAGLGDSFYEYLLKEYIRSNKRDKLALKMYTSAIDAVKAIGMIATSKKGHMFMADYRRGSIQNKMDHLACFAGGMFALGSIYTSNSLDWLRIGINITNTCHDSYAYTETKLGPESFHFTDNVEAIAIQPQEKIYLLRPETFESYFYLWRITKDQKYRDWAYEAVLALEKHAKVEHGLSGIRDVYTVPVTHDDVQQSFLMAETLKYLYLIFSEDSLLPLDRWVFNTEAHPFPIRDLVHL